MDGAVGWEESLCVECFSHLCIVDDWTHIFSGKFHSHEGVYNRADFG